MDNLILVKIGGSAITDKTKPRVVDYDSLKRITKEIHEARTEDSTLRLIIGHGAGSFGHVEAKKYQTHMGIINNESIRGIAVVQDSALSLNRIVVKELLDAGENAVSLPAFTSCYTKDGKIVEWYDKPIKMMLEHNLLVVPHGDVSLDTTKGCSIVSTEVVLNKLSEILKPKRLIIGGEVDGVFTEDPFKNPNAKLIPLITNNNINEVKKYLSGSRGTDVTGGMVHKVEQMLALAQKGFEIEIINIKKPGYLKRALLGEKGLGTIIRK